MALRAYRDYSKFSIENERNFRTIIQSRIDAGDNNFKIYLQSCNKNTIYLSWN